MHRLACHRMLLGKQTSTVTSKSGSRSLTSIHSLIALSLTRYPPHAGAVAASRRPGRLGTGRGHGLDGIHQLMRRIRLAQDRNAANLPRSLVSEFVVKRGHENDRQATVGGC